MTLFLLLIFLPLILALWEELLGLLVIFLGLLALAVAITIPRVIMEYPGLMALVVLAAIVTSIASTFLPRAIAWKLFEHRANRKAIRYRQGEDTLVCHVADQNRWYGSKIDQLTYKFVWFPAVSYDFPDHLRKILTILFYAITTVTLFLVTNDVRQNVWIDLEDGKGKNLYPWSAAASFALILAGTHWLDRRMHPQESMINALAPRFHRAVNRTLPLDGVNTPENQRLVEQVIEIGLSLSLSGERFGRVFLDHLAHAVATGLRQGRDPAALAAEVNTRLLAAIAELSEAKKAMQRIFALREQIQYVLKQRPDPSEQDFQIASFLGECDGWASLPEIVFDQTGLDSISAGRVKASRIADDLARYLAQRRGENSKGERARSERPSQGGRISRAEALSILGLQEGAAREQILAAHRRLIKAVHPDVGGTVGLATRLNEARDVLLA